MKTPLLLLHGALGAASQFALLRTHLQQKYEVHTPDFSGHGEGAPVGDFSIARFAGDVLIYMEENRVASAAVFGYSMGGYVGAWLARHHPERVSCLVTLATKWRWDEATALKETGMLVPDKILDKVPQLARALEERHPGKDWRQLVVKTAAMLTQMGEHPPLTLDDLKELSLPVTVLLGDRDKMVTLEETVQAYHSLPAGRMGMLPATPHPYEAVDPDLLSILIQHFI